MLTQYQKFLRDNQVIAQGLIGSFGDDDKYCVAKDTIDEIVGAKKLLTDYHEQDAFCELYTQENTYKFKFLFNVDSVSGKRYASFYLLENFTLFGEKNELVTFLVGFNDDDDVMFLDKLKKAFNLVTKDESEGKDIKNSDLKFEKLLKTSKQKQKILIKQTGTINKKYVVDILKLLKASGDKGNELLKLFNSKASKLKMDKLSPEYWNKLKDILDDILHKEAMNLPEKYKKMIDEVNEQYMLYYNNIRKAIVLDAPSKSSAKKPIIPAKKKGKSSGGGGGGKKGNKKTKGSEKTKSSQPSDIKLPNFNEMVNDINKELYSKKNTLTISSVKQTNKDENKEYKPKENEADNVLFNPSKLDSLKNILESTNKKAENNPTAVDDRLDKKGVTTEKVDTVNKIVVEKKVEEIEITMWWGIEIYILVWYNILK